MDEEDFSTLMYPVAECDLRQLLEDRQESWMRASESDEVEFELSESATKCWDELGLGGTLPRKGKDADQRWTLAIQQLQQVMGCITQAMLWMHSQGIQHRDLKPANILLRGPSEVFLTDFGISRHRSEAERTTTDLYRGYFWGYAASEVINQDWTNVREADIILPRLCVLTH